MNSRLLVPPSGLRELNCMLMLPECRKALILSSSRVIVKGRGLADICLRQASIESNIFVAHRIFAPFSPAALQ